MNGDEPTSAEKSMADFYLLQRMLVGIVVLGMDEFLQRLHEWQQTIDASPQRVWAESEFTDETSLDRFAYFMLGSLLRAEKTGVRLAAGGLQTLQLASQTAENVTRPFLHNRLTRPFERRFAKFSSRVEQQIRLSINEGRFENRRSRALTEISFDQLVNELIDYMANNPEVVELIQQQSVGLANVVIDNGRGLGVAADSAVETVLRRLLRMTPREQLPESPLTGVPQDMYDPSRRMPTDETT